MRSRVGSRVTARPPQNGVAVSRPHYHHRQPVLQATSNAVTKRGFNTDMSGWTSFGYGLTRYTAWQWAIPSWTGPGYAGNVVSWGGAGWTGGALH